MGTDHAGNKKWTGLKGPVGMLFSPRAAKRGSVTTGSRKSQDPVGENTSAVSSSTEYLTEADESPQTGKSNMLGRLRNQEDDVTLTPGGQSKRRPSGAMNLLRKAMFTQNPKEDNSIATEASRDIRGVTESYGIDPLFDDELTSSRRSSVKPPSCSDLSSSAAYSSRTDLSGQSTKVPSLKKGIEKPSDAMSQRPPRPSGTGEKGVGSKLSNDRNVASKSQKAHSANKTTKEGQGATKTGSERDPTPRSPRPMQTGVRNSLASALLNPSASADGALDASFHPTLSQKLEIGKQEIEKKLQVRKKPPIEPLKLAPSTKGQDRPAGGAKISSTNKTTSGTARSSGTRRKSTGSDVLAREASTKDAPDLILESPKRLTTPTVLQHSRILSPRDHSKASSQQSRQRRPHHSSEQTEERRRHNSDGTSRSRGRSGPRHSYDQSPKTPTGSHHSTKDRTYSHHRARRDNESSMGLPTISNLDGSPSRTPHEATKSPSRGQKGDVKRHVRSQDARHHASTREERRAVEEKKRSKSLDESLSRDKSVPQDHVDSIDDPDNQEADRSHSSGHHRKRDHSSPHSRESHRTRTQKSPAPPERKRSKSMDDNQSRSKSPHHLSRRSSSGSHNHSHSSGHRGHRGESSPHSPESHRKRTEKSPTSEERKRSKYEDDNQSRSKSPHYQSRRSSYDSRSHSSGHRSLRGESSPHSRESHRKRTEQSPSTPERKRSKSMDDSQSRSKSPHQQSRRPSHDSRHRHHNKEEESVRSRSRSRDASAPRDDLQSPDLAIRKRSLSLDESLSNRRSHHVPENDNLTAEREDKVTAMNELWNELTRYGPPHLKKQEKERTQKVVSKAEKERRGELGKSSRRKETTRPSQSPGRRTSNNDEDGTVTSGGTTSRKQTRRERRERGDDTSSSRASRQSTSPSHRSTSSSHRQVPQTPSGRSERSRTRSTSREKWQDMLHRSDTKTDTSNLAEPPFPTAVSNDGSEDKALPSPRSVSTDKSEGKASTSPRSVSTSESKGKTMRPGRTDNETSPAKDETSDPSPTLKPIGPASSIPPPMADSKADKYDKIPSSGILTANHYRNVNKMAVRTFHSPLDDPSGTYSPTQRQGNGRTRLLASSSSSSVPTTTEGISPSLDKETDNTTITATSSYQEDDNDRDNNNNDDVLLSPTSRAAKLKNHLRQLEQQHGSIKSSSNRSRSEPPISSSHTHHSAPGLSRNTRRSRTTEDGNGNGGTSGLPKPPSSPSHSGTTTSTSRSRQRSESGDATRRRQHNLMPHVDNSPGHGSQAWNTATSIKSPTKDLGRFLKSPQPENLGEEATKRQQGARANMSMESVPVSESTTES